MGRWGVWGDGEIRIFAQLNVFLMNILWRQRISPAGSVGGWGVREKLKNIYSYHYHAVLPNN
ncbi:hypothetical protein [Okeania sp. KiyG1]|uniref:hypothetical protein n=1 Tax=Okeania sp. KiyG1 TaxID=2720165 RepID=UPI0019237916|nr:hypothetical protein [Okeania sp. KiyG1]